MAGLAEYGRLGGIGCFGGLLNRRERAGHEGHEMKIGIKPGMSFI
jgi:hypothetical protein